MEWWQIGIVVTIYLLVLVAILVAHSYAVYNPEEDEED
jgi:hypothetical protein